MTNSTVNITQMNVIHSETGKMPGHLKRKYQDQVGVNISSTCLRLTVTRTGIFQNAPSAAEDRCAVS